MRPIGVRGRLRPVLQELEVRVVPVEERGLVGDLASKSARRHGTLCENKLWGVHAFSVELSSGHRYLLFPWSSSVLGPFGGGRHRLTPPSSVDLMRGARKHKELLLDALERIDHHTHRAGNNRLQDAYCPSLCWGKCLRSSASRRRRARGLALWPTSDGRVAPAGQVVHSVVAKDSRPIEQKL